MTGRTLTYNTKLKANEKKGTSIYCKEQITSRLLAGLVEEAEERVREREVQGEFGCGELGGASITAEAVKKKEVTSVEPVEEVDKEDETSRQENYEADNVNEARVGGYTLKKASKGQKGVVAKDGEIDKLRCVLEGERWEGSSGMKYEPYNKEDGVSDSDLSLQSECIIDEASKLRSAGNEGRNTSAGGEQRKREMHFMWADQPITGAKKVVVLKLKAEQRKVRSTILSLTTQKLVIPGLNTDADVVGTGLT
ncbi:LOW QUALITY PROTEIN: hypothetical protein Cgig2_031772 [Carnegiea gigantea]|uniref:Uncharacterized protein n=1 Tax=Carnegiea gigantea TaxID=171969 RepID=A0A9Q1QM38_9CARY|nr:LOW QUALITY PROTEIN: hypothetical protein Cgig2_031772 [Carnegiea gigantea]